MTARPFDRGCERIRASSPGRHAPSTFARPILAHRNSAEPLQTYGESDVKCFLCERFLGTTKDLPRLRQMHERFLSLGLKLKAEVVAAQIQQIEQRAQGETSAEASPPQTFIPLATVGVSARR